MKNQILFLLCSVFLVLFCAGFARNAMAAPTATISPVTLEFSDVCEGPSDAVALEVMPVASLDETAEEIAMPMLMAKFRCNRVDELTMSKFDRVPGAGIGGTDGFVDNGRREKYAEYVSLHPVYGAEGPNARWSKTTPAGNLVMQIDNPALWGKFKVGEDYFLNFEPATW